MAVQVAGVSEQVEVEPAGSTDDRVVDEVLAEDLLVEEVSIDGMCGVY